MGLFGKKNQSVKPKLVAKTMFSFAEGMLIKTKMVPPKTNSESAEKIYLLAWLEALYLLFYPPAKDTIDYEITLFVSETITEFTGIEKNTAMSMRIQYFGEILTSLQSFAHSPALLPMLGERAVEYLKENGYNYDFEDVAKLMTDYANTLRK